MLLSGLFIINNQLTVKLELSYHLRKRAYFKVLQTRALVMEKTLVCQQKAGAAGTFKYRL